MSLHVFANFVTPFGTAANNRAETEGNITTLQKLLWMGETHSTVSAEAIRFALRRRLGADEETNRSWDESIVANVWKDPQFTGWGQEKGKTFCDDDLLGFMIAEAAKEDGSDNGKGSANVRRAVLEVTRAISLTPWAGDVTFNAASPGATPSAQKKGLNPVPYGTELHATRFQYGIALTPERLRDKSRAARAIAALCNLGTVAGNHGRFLFDFSPDAVVFRLTQDPAPRLLYCFNTPDNGKSISAHALLQRIKSNDIDKKEIIVGVAEPDSALAKECAEAGISPVGVKTACDQAVKRINSELKVKE
jgi:CRISPR-associated protein Cst2